MECGTEPSSHSQLEFLDYDPDVQHDIIVVFDLLDRVKAGCFQAVFIAPPASTWSRSRHLGPTQTQLRSRAQPLGLPSLGALAQSRISEANRTLEVCTWLVQQALFARVPCVLLFPEDLGGHSYSGPSSPWALQDWRFLEGLGDARRGSAFLCRLAAADHRCPTGFITNLDELIDDIYLGWPRLLPLQQDLYYDGPLPKVCPCTTLHGDLVGRDPDSVLLSTSCPIIPAGLWRHFFRDLLAARSSSSLRVGAFPSTSPATVASSTRLADAPGSWFWLYDLWQSGQLTRVALADVTDGAHIQQYLSSPSSTTSPSTTSTPRFPSSWLCFPGLRRSPLLWALPLLRRFVLVLWSALLRPRSRRPALVGCLPRLVLSGILEKLPRTSEFHAGQFELEGQESPKTGRQVQLFRGTVPILPPPATAQNSDGPSHEVQMGGPGPRGPHLATGAFDLSPGRSELMATGTTAAGGVSISSSTRPRSSRSMKAPLGPKNQRETDGNSASSLPGGDAQ